MADESSFDDVKEESSGKSESCLVEKKKKQLLEELEAMISTPITPGNEPRRTDCEEVNETLQKKVKVEYSREEMEALRFANMAEQRRIWKNVCNGLAPLAKKEYDGLAAAAAAGGSKRNKKDGNKQRSGNGGKKQVSTPLLGEACSELIDNGLSDRVKSGADDAGPFDAACRGYNIGDEDKYEALEEEYSEEEDDSDEEYASIQRPAFVVEGEPNFESGPPEDGLEYLRRVRWEAAQIPKIRVAKLHRSKLKKEQSEYMPKIPEIAKCPEHLLPAKQWEDAFLAEFSQLRLALSCLEISSIKNSGDPLSEVVLPEKSYSHQSSWSINVESSPEEIKTKVHPDQSYDCSGSENENDQLSCLSTDEDSGILPSPDKLLPKSSVTEDYTNYPLLSAILKMDSVSRVSMLKKRISSFVGTNTLSRNDCLWLFALCAVVDTPLDADTCASLRSLLRKSASFLAGKSELDDEVVMLNILATISGRYFGQLES
ncbi:Gem-associated protein 2 [Morus notabilis]|uniref:Gem-associated protein 2 n=1 Tax=Morus notabilis TaxID=981085 RepID=W9RT15_9ROSA|nr:gem-associated protein 2 [Morus notabilis]EXB68029.1 Gem-associated protein 2 [Morus notabilis]